LLIVTFFFAIFSTIIDQTIPLFLFHYIKISFSLSGHIRRCYKSKGVLTSFLQYSSVSHLFIIVEGKEIFSALIMCQALIALIFIRYYSHYWQFTLLYYNQQQYSWKANRNLYLFSFIYTLKTVKILVKNCVLNTTM